MATQSELLFILRMRDEATRVLQGYGSGLNTTATQAREAKAQLAEMQSAMRDVVTAVAAITAQTILMRRTIGVFAEYQEGMLGVQKTTDLTDAQMREFADRFDELATSMPVPIEQMQAAAIAAGQLGVQGVDGVIAFTETIAKMGTATDLAGEEAAVSLARMLNVFNEAPQEVERLGSVLVALGNNSAATEREIARIATEISLATSVFEIGTTEASAIGAAMAELGLRAEISGTAVGRTFRALDEAIHEGGESLTLLTQITGYTAEQLQDLSASSPIELFTVFVESLGLAIENGWEYRDVLESLGLQQEEINKTIVPLAKNYQNLSEKQRLARKEAEEMAALDKEFAKFSEGINAQLKLLQNNFDILGKSIGSDVAPLVTEGLKTIIAAVQEVTEVYQNLPDPIREATAVIVTFGSTAVAVVASLKALRSAMALLGVSMLATPWGAAILAAATLAGGLLYLASQQQTAKNASEEQRDALARLKEALDNVNLTDDAAIEGARQLAEAHLVAARGALEQAKAELQLAEAMAHAENAAFVVGAAEAGLHDPRVEAARQLVVDLNAAVARAEQEIAEFENRVTTGGTITDPTTTPGTTPVNPPTLPTVPGSGGTAAADIQQFEEEQRRRIELIHEEIAAINEGVAAYEAYQLAREIQAEVEAIRERAEALGMEEQAIDDLAEAYEEAAKKKQEADKKMDEAIKKQQEAKDLADQLANSIVMTGYNSIMAGDSFEDTMKRIALAVAEVIVQMLILEPLIESLSNAFQGGGGGGGGFFSNFFSSLVGSLFGAKGLAFEAGKAIPLAKGGAMDGVLRRPTAFTMRSGGVAFGGELDDEALMPLRRMPNGDLGIQAIAGGGNTGGPSSVAINITVNGARGNQEIREMVSEGVSEGLSVYDREVLPTKVRSITSNDLRHGDLRPR